MLDVEVVPQKSWEEKTDQLEQQFADLSRPSQPKSIPGIPSHLCIEGIGRQLLHMAPVSQPDATPPKEGLENVAEALTSLIDALDHLPAAAIPALNLQTWALARLKLSLRWMKANVHREMAASVDIAVVSHAPGAPRKTQATAIAMEVAWHYFRLTGKKPTVSNKGHHTGGPFVELLDKVYKILGVKASPASQASKIAKNWTASARPSL